MTRYEEMTIDMETLIKPGIRKGYSACTLIKHFQVYRCYLVYRGDGYSVCDAVMLTADAMKVSESWIFVIIKKMEAEV